MNSVVERLRTGAMEMHHRQGVNPDSTIFGQAADLIASKDAEIERLTKERDALQAFKDYTHRRLDEAGVPTHPGGEHSKAGCRIGDRMDLVATRAETAERLLAEATAEVERMTPQFVAYDYLEAPCRREQAEDHLAEIIRAYDANSGAEPSVSVLARAIDAARTTLSNIRGHNG